MAHTYEDEQLAFNEYKDAHFNAEVTAGTIARLVVKYDTLPSLELRTKYLTQLDEEIAAWRRYLEIRHAGQEVSA